MLVAVIHAQFFFNLGWVSQVAFLCVPKIPC